MRISLFISDFAASCCYLEGSDERMNAIRTSLALQKLISAAYSLTRGYLLAGRLTDESYAEFVSLELMAVCLSITCCSRS